jgi:hypothetical protein
LKSSPAFWSNTRAPEGSLAGLDLIDDGLRVRHEIPGVGGGALDVADAGEQLVVQLRVVEELAERALAAVQLFRDLLEVGGGGGDFIAVFRDELVEFLEEAATLAAEGLADVVGDALQLGAERAELGDHLVHVRRAPRPDLAAGTQGRQPGAAETHLEVVGAKEGRLLHAGDGVLRNLHGRVDLQHGFDALRSEAGAGDGADFDACHEDFVAGLEPLEVGESGGERVALRLEDLPAGERFECHPGQGDAEQEEEPDAEVLLRVIHGCSTVF